MRRSGHMRICKLLLQCAYQMTAIGSPPHDLPPPSVRQQALHLVLPHALLRSIASTQLYADDLACFATSAAGLQRMLEVVRAHSLHRGWVHGQADSSQS